jgi:hypothetical protein
MIIVLKTRNLIYRMVTILSTDGQRQQCHKHNTIEKKKKKKKKVLNEEKLINSLWNLKSL